MTLSVVFSIMQLIPVTLQSFPKAEEPSISGWSESSESGGESFASYSDVMRSDEDEKDKVTKEWVEETPLPSKVVLLETGDEIVKKYETSKGPNGETGKKQEDAKLEKQEQPEKGTLDEQQGDVNVEQQGHPKKASTIYHPYDQSPWALGYFPRCPVFYRNVYEHHLEAPRSEHDRENRVWHLVLMDYVSSWFQEATWELLRTKDAMPQLQSCSVIIEEYKNPKTQGEYVVYGRYRLPEAAVGEGEGDLAILS